MDVALQDGKIAAMGARNVACAAVLSAEDGKTLWKSATLPWRGLIGPVAPWPPMLVGNYVVMSARQGVGFEILESYVMALDASSGKVTWTTGLRKALPMSVASDGIRLWALGRERELVCMDLRSGSRIWESKEVQDAEAGPVLSGEVLLVLDKDVLRGFCAADGRVLWTIALDKQLDARRLLVCNGYVVLTGPTHIAVFKAK
jgi:outer membrane protein assembly factor BamB